MLVKPRSKIDNRARLKPGPMAFAISRSVRPASKRRFWMIDFSIWCPLTAFRFQELSSQIWPNPSLFSIPHHVIADSRREIVQSRKRFEVRRDQHAPASNPNREPVLVPRISFGLRKVHFRVPIKMLCHTGPRDTLRTKSENLGFISEHCNNDFAHG